MTFQWIVDHPILMSTLSFAVLWAAIRVGAARAKAARASVGDTREALRVVLGATLTLLGLIIGFSFSMALGRYDQRKTYEEAEANAIGTEFLRVELLPADTAVSAKDLLRQYIQQRISFYEERDDRQLLRIDGEAAVLQNRMWSTVRAVALSQPTPVVALAAAGMNDVFNAQGYTQAIWWNRVPEGAWLLMTVIAVIACALTGYGAPEARPLLILPTVLAVAFFFLSDIDSPRHGLIRVVPQNLLSLAASMRAR